MKHTYRYIYKITNLLNNKIYIGKHKTNRLHDGYFGSGVYLKRAIQKYGKENFKKELICICVDDEELNEMEIYYIEKFNSTDQTIGYNLTKGGDGGEFTEEAKHNLSIAMQGKPSWNKGKKLSEEIKIKMSTPKKKFKWKTPSGEIVEMSINNVKQWHPDWTLLEE